MILLLFVLFAVEILYVNAAVPVFNPVIYNIEVGLNTTKASVLTTLTATDADGDALTYATSNTGGASYFGVDDSGGSVNLILVNLLDVEYGNIQWDFKVTASDGTNRATATVSVTTYQSTTSSVTTEAPPGYDWFSETNNAILFASVMAFSALLTSACVLCCWKFHRDGTCLPESCPTYKQCCKSARRTCNCPIPCNFYKKKKKKKRKAKRKEEKARQKKTETPPAPPKVVYSEEKEKEAAKEVKEPKKVAKPAKKPEKEARNGSVTPISIGNVSLHDVGMDRARTPGFNAPATTAYGGKRSISPKLFRKK